MKFYTYRDPIPYVVIEDVFDEVELERIFKELEFLYPKLLPPTQTHTYKDENGQPGKSNQGVFLDDVYQLREFSDILSVNRKLFNPEVKQQLSIASPIFSLIDNLRRDATLISYYEDSDYYLPHSDTSVISMVTWFFKEPKNFIGGDFILTDYNIKIPVKNNCTVIFFGNTKHEVTEIKMIDPSEHCSGRFSMTVFVVQS
jgi:hypothetical protein